MVNKLARGLARIPRQTFAVPSVIRWRILSERFRLPSVRLDDLTNVQRAELDELILDDVCMPPFVGSPGCDDLCVVLRIAKGLQSRLICEIGTSHGNLSANLLRNCSESRLITVNAPFEAQTGTFVTHKLTEVEIGRVYRKYGFQTRVTQLLVNSLDLDLSGYVADGGLDLAIVDGCHDTPFVTNDFHKVRRFIRPGGVVLFHDTHPSQKGHLAGSYRACLRLRQHGFDVKWIEETWWGYWRHNGR